MHALFSTNTDDVLAVFGSIQPSPNKGISDTASSLFAAIVQNNKTQPAILPPTVGWFLLTLESSQVQLIKLYVLGTNLDGYLVFVLLENEFHSQLCSLSRGSVAELRTQRDGTAITLTYDNNSVILTTQAAGGQRFSKRIIAFTGQVPKSTVGKGEPVARPLDDQGSKRTYLDHTLVNALGERAPVAFARTHHGSATTYPKHAHADDNIRFICSGKFRFTIFDPGTDAIVHECEVVSGDSIQIPAGYAYIEQVLEPGVQHSSRTTFMLHYKSVVQGNLHNSRVVPLSLEMHGS